MHITCPTCGERFPLSAGFADDDGKRLAAQLADLEPVLGRAVIGYLRLFKPQKQQLRSARATRIIAALAELVHTGTVCRDERGGVRRPASQVLWAEGIEQMLAAPGRLILPLTNHHYLRAIVYSLADKADAAAERQHEADLRAGRHLGSGARTAPPENKLANELAWLRQMRDYGEFSADEYEARAQAARQRYEESST